MRFWRILYRLPLGIGATALCAFVPFAVRVLTLGGGRVSTRAGVLACRAWGRILCALLGVRVRLEGSVPRGRSFLVASNHLSYLDIMLLGGLYPTLFVAKREIGSWPVFGWIARTAGTLFVDRERASDVVRVGHAIEKRLEAGFSMTLFPEGRSTRGEAVLPFLPSLLEPAARLRVPCHAVAIRYETPGVDLSPSVTVCWYDRMRFPGHILRLMRIPRIEATVRFSDGPVVSGDRKELARVLWESVSGSFVPVRQ